MRFKAILTIRINGLGSEHRTAIFPKLIFTVKRGLNLEPDSPNYDIKTLALECATKRMYPDMLSYDKIIDLTGSFKSPMGCRSFLQGWKDENGQDVTSGRMNLGVVTLNLPRIAMESNGDMDKFWELFNERMLISKDALIYRVERVTEAKPANAPILYQYGAFGKRLEKTGNVNDLFKNRRATVSLGYIGLYEVASVFYGGQWEGNPDAKAFTLSIVKAMKQACEDWSDEYGYHFSVYSTPSESLTDRFCRLDTEKFGIVTDITDKEYYTNSFHYDVRKSPTPFEKLDFEKIIQKQVLQVVLSTTVSILFCNKIQRPWKRFGTMLMIVWGIWEPIRLLINAIIANLKAILPQQNVVLLAQTVAIMTLKQLMWSNVHVVTWGILRPAQWLTVAIRKSLRV